MTNGKYIFTAMLGVASLNAMAQCPIKDEIMGNHPVKELNARVPDGVFSSSGTSPKNISQRGDDWGERRREQRAMSSLS